MQVLTFHFGTRCDTELREMHKSRKDRKMLTNAMASGSHILHKTTVDLR